MLSDWTAKKEFKRVKRDPLTTDAAKLAKMAERSELIGAAPPVALDRGSELRTIFLDFI